ncbi:unnamed protein product [Coffea canephora]|uniref:DH200=94 genomic scaffold, scaffold_371 n=1 Tax=Coffea canephora TaxID=49390 RepID=A0A068VHR9_COFCA|nr:unnamed protein product [Coffea canephora]
MLDNICGICCIACYFSLAKCEKFKPFVFNFQEIQIDELITHDLPFEDVNKAFDLMREGNCLRCVIHMPK